MKDDPQTVAGHRDEMRLRYSTWDSWFVWQIEGAYDAAIAGRCRRHECSPQTEDDDLPNIGTDHMKLIEEHGDE